MVWISLTTIPSRVGTTLFDTLASLVRQTHAVDRIIVTIPLVNMRGIPANIDMSEEELREKLDGITTKQQALVVASRVKGKSMPDAPPIMVIRPKYDWGPIMKYMGVLEYVEENKISHHQAMSNMILIVDDDQLYHRDILQTRLRQNANYRQTHNVSKHDVITAFLPNPHTFLLSRRVRGSYSVLMSGQSIYDARVYIDNHMKRKHLQQLEECCALNDDVLISLALHYTGKRFDWQSDSASEVFSTTRDPTDSPDALHGNPNKSKHMIQCNLKHKEKDIPLICVWGICAILGFVLIIMLFVRILTSSSGTVYPIRTTL
jgi:hypothetical protein